MTARVTAATAVRVLRQLRRDPRTLALLFGVPCLLLWLLKELLAGQPETFQRVGGPLVGLFPFVSMFVVTSVGMLRERTTGTLERLMALPLAKLDLLAGYGAAFALVAAAQCGAVSALGFGGLGLSAAGSLWVVIAFAIGNALLGMALGLFLSAFATTEFQAVQFMPAVVFPQVLLSGLFVPRARMAHGLQIASDALPLTYAYDALDRTVRGGTLGARVVVDAAVIGGSVFLALALGAATLRRRTP